MRHKNSLQHNWVFLVSSCNEATPKEAYETPILKSKPLQNVVYFTGQQECQDLGQRYIRVLLSTGNYSTGLCNIHNSK